MKRVKKCTSLAQLRCCGTKMQTQICQLNLSTALCMKGNTEHRTLESLHNEIEKIGNTYSRHIFKYKNLKLIIVVLAYIKQCQELGKRSM